MRRARVWVAAAILSVSACDTQLLPTAPRSAPTAPILAAVQAGHEETTFGSLDVPKSILDNHTIESTITVPNVGVLYNVTVKLSINHTFDHDLRVSIRSPAGTSVTLVNSRGGAGANFINTVFDDDALTSIGSGTAPFTGSFRPEEGLRLALRLQDAGGDWTLAIQDQEAGDQGTLLSWSLTIEHNPLAPPPVTSCVAGNFLSGGACYPAPIGSYVPLDGATAATPCPPGSTTLAEGAIVCLTNIAQTITFASSPPPSLVLGTAYGAAATGGPSGNPVVITSLTPTICPQFMPGSIVGLVAEGTCTVAANQTGGGAFLAAPQVTQSFEVVERMVAAGSASHTFQAEGLPTSILDNRTIESTLTVPSAFLVRRVWVNFTIAHAHDGDLRISLRSPAGTTVTLVNARGGSGADFRYTHLDDDAIVAIGGGTAPFTGAFRPEERLTTALGLEDARGTWTLAIQDQGTGDEGTLLHWSLTFEHTIGCSAGTYSATGLYPCVPAPAGSYVALGGATSATPCPAGYFAASAGSMACTPAPAGFYVPTPGSSAATQCPSGFTSSPGATACTPPPIQPISITINPNVIQMKANGRIMVAILTRGTFNAADIDPITVTLGDEAGGDTPVASRGNSTLFASLEDSDGDGRLDLVVHFERPALVANGDLTAGTVRLVLLGRTRAGAVVRGQGPVSVKP